VSATPPDGALIVSVAPGEVRVGRIEKGRLAEVLIQRGSQDTTGEIRRAILRGKDAASGGGFLDVGDGIEAYLTNPGDAPLGAKLLVQITKPAIADKRAEARRRIEIMGEALILTPVSEGIEISRKLDRPARDRLKAWGAAAGAKGLTIRTAAAAFTDQALTGQLAALQRAWSALVPEGPPGLALAAPDPLTRAIAALDEGAGPICISGGHCAGYEGRLQVLPVGREAFAWFGLEEQLEAALLPSVALSSGGRLHIDTTRMATTVDIDTAGAASGEEVGREAMVEIARQIRLRNLSGLILIDPPRKGPREPLLASLRVALAADRVPSVIHGVTKAGLIEISRPRLRPSLAELMLAPAASVPSVAASLLSLLRQAAYGPLLKALEVSRAGDAWLAGEGERAWLDFVRHVGYAPRRLVRSDVADHYGRLIFPGEE